MAKKLKPAEAKGVSASDLKRVVRDVNRHRENASENAGLAGQSVKQAVEQYNLDRPALMAVVRLSRAEPAKQQSTLRGIIDYADKLGMFDQIDAFDDLVPTLERIIERAKNTVGPDNHGLGGAPSTAPEDAGGEAKEGAQDAGNVVSLITH